MDTIGIAAQAEGAEKRTGGARRRRRAWSIEEKQRIVAESRVPGASASVVAQRHDVNTNQLFTWRRQFESAEAGQSASFVPAAITPAAPAGPCSRDCSRIEIVLANGARVIIGADVDESALARVIRVLTRQR